MLWVEGWIDLIGIILIKNYSKYQRSIPKKSCICSLISRMPLSDTDECSREQRAVTLGVC